MQTSSPRPPAQAVGTSSTSGNPTRLPGWSHHGSADSFGAELSTSSSRARHGKAKRKRLEKLGGLADIADNYNEVHEESEHRSARVRAKSTSIKAKSQIRRHKKLDKANEVAAYPDKDLVGELWIVLVWTGMHRSRMGPTRTTKREEGMVLCMMRTLRMMRTRNQKPKQAHPHLV
ncbi:unnamed protein product [Penicillium glandicola]